MHKCKNCDKDPEGAVVPAEGKKRNSFLAFFSFLFFLPHLTPENERSRKREILDVVAAAVLALLSVVFFIGLVVPVAQQAIGTDPTRLKTSTYSALSLLPVASALSKGGATAGIRNAAKAAYGLTVTTLVFMLVGLIFAIFCLVCKRKGYFSGKNILFTAIRDAVYLVFLVLAIVLFASTKLSFLEVVAANSAQKGETVQSASFGVAPALLLGMAAASATVAFGADLIRVWLLKSESYKTGETQGKLLKRASDVNSISSRALENVHSVLEVLPYILVVAFCVVAVILCFAPQNSFLSAYSGASSFVSRMKGLIKEFGDDNTYSRYNALVGQMSKVRDTAMANIVLSFLFLGAAVYGLVIKLMRRENVRRYIRALPYLIYGLMLFIGLVTMLPIIGNGTYPIPAQFDYSGGLPFVVNEAGVIAHTRQLYLLAGLLPICLLIVLSAIIPYIKDALFHTFDYRLGSGVPHAYEKDEKLYHFNLMRGVTSVGEYAFSSCKRLASVVLTDDVESIGMSAFETCSLLGRAVLGSSLKEIGDYAFLDCENLSEILLPASCKHIGIYAFANCILLKTIRYQGTCEEWEAVEKGEHWDEGIGTYCVRCSDGTLVVEA